MQKTLKCIIGIIFTSLILISVISVFISKYLGLYTYNYPIPSIVMAIIGLTFILLVGFFLNRLTILDNEIYKKRITVIILILSVLHFLILIFLSHNYYFIAGWDCMQITGAADNLASASLNTYNVEYLSRFPNNVLITKIFSIIIKCVSIVGYLNGYFACIVFQCSIFSLVGLILFLAVRNLNSTKSAILAYIIYLPLVGFSPWVVVPYSDSVGLFFPICFIFLYAKAKKAIKSKPKIIYMCLITLLAYPAYKIKPQTSIVVIAIIIVTIINFDIKKTSVPKIVFPFISLFVGALITILFTSNISKLLDAEAETSPWYYFCMGANSEYNGICNPIDQQYALSFDTKEERDIALKERYLEYMNNNGVGGTLMLALKKNTLNYYDGSFGWWGEGSFLHEEIYGQNASLRNLLSSIYYGTEKNFSLYKTLVQILWLGLLSLCPFAIKKAQKDDSLCLIMLSIIGVSIFEMIFECRARYMFTFIPLYIVVCVCGINDYWKNTQKE